MASQAQINANRKNSQNSTGPVTEAGKAKVRRNATRHNLCSDIALQSDEDREEFDLLLGDLRTEHKPEGPTEDILCFKMAEAHWFGWRASIILANQLNINEEQDNQKQVSLFMRYHTTSGRAFVTFLNELRKAKKERRLEDALKPENEGIGFVSQNAEAPPEPASPPPPPPFVPVEEMEKIVVERPNQPTVVLTYVEPSAEEIRQNVDAYLARKKNLR